MQTILLAIIAGLLSVDIIFKHGDGKFNWNVISLILGFAIIGGAIFLVVTYFINGFIHIE
jgi:hypothetical protein